MIRYLRFLREKSATGGVSEGLRDAGHRFPENQPDLVSGFTKNGNKGLGLGGRLRLRHAPWTNTQVLS